MNDLGSIIVFLFALSAGILVLASMWKVYTKAGKPGWAIVIPLYNLIVLLQIVGKPWWWIFLFLIPVLNAIISCIVHIHLAKSFGKSGVFGFFFLFLFGFIGYPILGFGKSQYLGNSHVGNRTQASTPVSQSVDVPPSSTA